MQCATRTFVAFRNLSKDILLYHVLESDQTIHAIYIGAASFFRLFSSANYKILVIRMSEREQTDGTQ